MCSERAFIGDVLDPVIAAPKMLIPATHAVNSASSRPARPQAVSLETLDDVAAPNCLTVESLGIPIHAVIPTSSGKPRCTGTVHDVLC